MLVGFSVLISAAAGVLILQPLASNEAATRRTVENAAIRSYEQVYSAHGVAADSSALRDDDCVVVDLFDPDLGLDRRPISVVLTRNSSIWTMMTTARDGVGFDSDDVGSGEECRELARRKESP